jgi:hypothetical protein
MNSTETAHKSDVKRLTGYVAFLDVLGFRAIVGRQDAVDRLEKYVNTVDSAIQTAGPQALQYVIFSDSIVISSDSDDEACFDSIVAACGTLFAEFLQKRIAMRGAIAHGQFLRSTKTNGAFVAGRPIVDAYDYETRQDWVGILLCPSTIESKVDLSQKCQLPSSYQRQVAGFDFNTLNLPMLFQRNFRIPFHRNDESSLTEPDTYDGLALLPTGAGTTLSNITSKLDLSLRSLDYLKSVAPDPRSQQKFSYTIDWLNGVRQSWNEIAHEYQVSLTR